MPVIDHANVPVEPFRGGAIYQTVIGDFRRLNANKAWHSDFSTGI